MTAQRDRSNSKTRGTLEEQEQDSLLLSYAKSIGDPDSMWLLPQTEGVSWAMRCPLRVHPGKARTFILDSGGVYWWCTACETHGDMVDLAAKLNRFSRAEAAQVIEIYRRRMRRSAKDRETGRTSTWEATGPYTKVPRRNL